MNHNRSLKDFLLRTTRNKQERPVPPPVKFITTQQFSNNSRFNLDNILKQLENSPPINYNKKDIKKCNSQQKLDIPAINFKIKSNHIQNHPIKTDRIKKYQINQQGTLQLSTQHIKNNPSPFNLTLNVLTPVDKNVNRGEEPKKPKILIKQKPICFSEQFKIGKILGKGRFGNVYRAQNIQTNFLVAVKQISLEKISKKLVERLTWEIKIQAFLKHENCLELYRCIREGNNLYLLLEHGDCSLFDKLRQKRFFTETETCYYVTQTIKALIHMHKQGIIHRDLKPQNIVLINNVVKLADFGWSIFIGKFSKRTTFCGTLDYVSPEIVMGDEYDEMVDVWGVGVLCYQLCTGHAPFASKLSTRQQTFRKILRVDLKFPKYLSQDLKDFISRLLTRVPQQRMSLEQALCHKWMQRNSGK